MSELGGYRPVSRPARSTPFSSTTHALRELVINRVDGYAMANTNDPQRLKLLVEAAGGDKQARPATHTREFVHAENMALVSRAFDTAFAVLPHDSINEDESKQMLLFRYVGNRPPLDIADRFTRHDRKVTDTVVVLVTRYGFRRIDEALQIGGLVPREDLVADCFGWEEVGITLGISGRHAQRWAALYALPVRLIKVGTRCRVEASTEELMRWRREREGLR